MLSVARAVRMAPRAVADGVPCRSSKTALEIALFALATGVCVSPVATSAQTSVPPSAPSSVVSGPPASPGPDLIDLLRPCAPGVSGVGAALVHVPPGVGVWGARCERRPLDAQYVSGTVTESASQYYVRTGAGAQLRLVSAFPHVSDFDMSYAWMRGFMDAGDGPIVLQGAFAPNDTFAVHGFALRLSPGYESFTFGRVMVTPTEPPRPYIASPHFGVVEIGAGELRALLQAMPRLGVILPGEPVKIGNAWVYQGIPPRFFGLARPTAGTQPGPNQTIVVTGDMALSVFVRKPIELPERFRERTQHRNRFWVEGIPVAGPDGAIVRWVGTYASPPTDLGPPMPDAASRP